MLFSIGMDKTEYIRQLKILLKKYHPDLNRDEGKTQELTDITRKLNLRLREVRDGTAGGAPAPEFVPRPEPEAGEKPRPAPVADPAYAYYRRGIEAYRRIHPDQFYKRNTDNPYESLEYEAQVAALKKISTAFTQAEYYFRRVFEDFPASPWAADARSKSALLKKLRKSYEHRSAEEIPPGISAKALARFVSDMGLHPAYVPGGSGGAGNHPGGIHQDPPS